MFLQCVGTTKLDPTDGAGKDFCQSPTPQKFPPLYFTVERDAGHAPDMSFGTVTAYTVNTLTELKGPYRLVVSDGKIIVAERLGNCVKVMNVNGSIIKIIGVGQMERPGGVALDSRGNIYVTSNHKLQIFSGRLLHLGQVLCLG